MTIEQLMVKRPDLTGARLGSIQTLIRGRLFGRRLRVVATATCLLFEMEGEVYRAERLALDQPLGGVSHEPPG